MEGISLTPKKLKIFIYYQIKKKIVWKKLQMEVPPSPPKIKNIHFLSYFDEILYDETSSSQSQRSQELYRSYW